MQSNDSQTSSEIRRHTCCCCCCCHRQSAGSGCAEDPISKSQLVTLVCLAASFALFSNSNLRRSFYPHNRRRNWHYPPYRQRFRQDFGYGDDNFSRGRSCNINFGGYYKDSSNLRPGRWIWRPVMRSSSPASTQTVSGSEIQDLEQKEYFRVPQIRVLKRRREWGLESMELERNAEIEEINDQVEEISVPADDLETGLIRDDPKPWKDAMAVGLELAPLPTLEILRTDYTSLAGSIHEEAKKLDLSAGQKTESPNLAASNTESTLKTDSCSNSTGSICAADSCTTSDIFNSMPSSHVVIDIPPEEEHKKEQDPARSLTKKQKKQLDKQKKIIATYHSIPERKAAFRNSKLVDLQKNKLPMVESNQESNRLLDGFVKEQRKSNGDSPRSSLGDWVHENGSSSEELVEFDGYSEDCSL